MRTWSMGQVKMHISNDNPFEAEELTALLIQRTSSQHALGDMPLIVISRGRPDDPSDAGRAGEDEHKREQASLAALSSAGRHVVATRSGHHVPLEEPELVVSAIRDILAAARR